MNLFDTHIAILIAVDDLFTFKHAGILINKVSIHPQFINRYYIFKCEHTEKIKRIVAVRRGAIGVINKCFDSVINIAKAYTKMVLHFTDNKLYWDYQSVKDTFDKLVLLA